MDGPEWFDDIGGKKISQFSIRFSTTSLQNLMSIIEATVSSLGRSSVGPKTTPRLAAVIKLVSCLAATRPKILGHKTGYRVSNYCGREQVFFSNMHHGPPNFCFQENLLTYNTQITMYSKCGFEKKTANFHNGTKTVFLY